MKILNMALRALGTATVPGDQSRPMSPEAKKNFSTLLKQCNFIVIDSGHLLKVFEGNLETNALTEQIEICTPDLAEMPICPPFKAQWVEISYKDESSMVPSINFEGRVVTVLGMLINETSPNVYDIYTYESHNLGSGLVHRLNFAKDVSGLNPGDTNLQMTFAVWIKAINRGP